MGGNALIASLLLWSFVTLACTMNTASAFTTISPHQRHGVTKLSNRFRRMPILSRKDIAARASETDDEELRVQQEEARMKVLTSRRTNIRSVLKSAESLKNFRLKNGTLLVQTKDHVLILDSK